MRNSLRFAVLASAALTAASCGEQHKENRACRNARARLEASGMDLIESGNELFRFKTDGPERAAALKKRRKAIAAESAAHDAIAKYCPR